MEKIDLTYLNEMSDGSKDLIFEMTEIYKSQIPEFIELMNLYYNNKEYDKLSAISHKAKSSVSIFGLNELAKDLKNLEIDAKQKQNVDSYIKTIKKFTETTQQSITDLNNHIKSL